jgi:DNA-binding response OmpR family regulator
MTICPCCGRPSSNAPEVLVDLIDFSNISGCQLRVARALLASYPRWVSKDALVEATWSLRNQPTNARNDIQTLVSHIRRKIKGSGWTIRNARFTGYRFEQVRP